MSSNPYQMRDENQLRVALREDEISVAPASDVDVLVAVINDGSIVASGPAAEVFDSTEPLVHQLVSGGTSGPIGLRDV